MLGGSIQPRFLIPSALCRALECAVERRLNTRRNYWKHPRIKTTHKPEEGKGAVPARDHLKTRFLKKPFQCWWFVAANVPIERIIPAPFFFTCRNSHDEIPTGLEFRTYG